MPTPIKASFKLREMHLDEMVSAVSRIDFGIQAGHLVDP